MLPPPSLSQGIRKPRKKEKNKVRVNSWGPKLFYRGFPPEAAENPKSI